MAYAQNVLAVPKERLSKGKVYVSKKQASQRAAVQIDMNEPRTLVGKISERITQVIGASVIA